ncbi:MAG: discoidin domain-containing protein [Trueperaceae bacterium]|nr:discoidin domain-containing protein [Trueperaceae bacterium]
MQLQSIRLLTAALALSAALAFAQSADFDVAAGKLVTSSRPAAEAYPDGDGLKLTDGAYVFSWADMVGFEGVEPVALTVDLGAVYDSISYVALKVMRSDGSAVGLPTAIVSVSEDGLLWEDLGLANVALEGEIANDTVGTLVWADEAWAGYGQFVRVELLPTAGWAMVAELEVGNGSIPLDRLPAGSANAPATAEAVNVALGKTYSLQPAASEAYPDPDGGKLTDGSYAYAWGDMVGIADATFSPVVVVDLGEHVDGITRVAGLFMRSFASAVNLPYSILVSVSDDGENFEVVGLAAKTAPSPAMNELINSVYWQDLQEPVGGRYVKLQIRHRTGWIMLAEVVVQTGAAVPEVQEAAE